MVKVDPNLIKVLKIIDPNYDEQILRKDPKKLNGWVINADPFFQNLIDTNRKSSNSEYDYMEQSLYLFRRLFTGPDAYYIWEREFKLNVAEKGQYVNKTRTAQIVYGVMHTLGVLVEDFYRTSESEFSPQSQSLKAINILQTALDKINTENNEISMLCDAYNKLNATCSSSFTPFIRNILNNKIKILEPSYVSSGDMNRSYHEEVRRQIEEYIKELKRISDKPAPPALIFEYANEQRRTFKSFAARYLSMLVRDAFKKSKPGLRYNDSVAWLLSLLMRDRDQAKLKDKDIIPAEYIADKLRKKRN